MTTGQPESRRRSRASGTGFTLVELLVVITIILLLATLLIPTVNTIINQVYVGRSAVMVKTFHNGAMLYKEKTGFFPGEIKEGSFDPNSWRLYGTGGWTGSQVLAACMFDIDYNRLNTPVDVDDIDASKAYIPFKPEYLFSCNVSRTKSPDYKHNTISDGFPKGKAKAMLYFLASNALSDKNKLTQFKFKQNEPYLRAQTEGPNLNQTMLQTWVSSRSVSATNVLNNGEFILIAPGLNRTYLLTQVENPANPNAMLSETDKDDIANDYSGLVK